MMNTKPISRLTLLGTICVFPFFAHAQETVTSSNGKYHANARMAVPAVLKPYGYTCPVLERKRGVKVQISPNGSEVKVATLDGISKSYTVKPNYNHWKSRSMACLRAKIQEDGKPVRFALCAKLKSGNGKSPQDWRSRGVFMAKNGSKKEVNVGHCK